MTRLQSSSALTLALTLAVAGWGGLRCHAADRQPTGTSGLDARHVQTQLPTKLVTDQVFEAKVTVKNTGTRPWTDGLKLRSEAPPESTNWGTTFIYLGQGRSCPPGEEITLSSWLKAPSKPGEYVFQWRMARNTDGAPFGQPTLKRTIVVEPRPVEAPAKPPVQPARGKRVLTADDFEYVGSFKVPDAVEGCGAAYTESGLALRKAADGTQTLFVRTGLHKRILYEAVIPKLVKLQRGDHSVLEVAPVKRVWGQIKLPGQEKDAIEANAGFWWDETRQMLYWSYYHGYCTWRPPVLGASRLVEGQPAAQFGPWSVPESVPAFKSYWGGVTPLPKEFAERYTGGRRIGLGFGGYYSICASASKGPALAAIAAPDPEKDTLDMVELLSYPWSQEACAPRDGDYFVANCSWGGRPPESPGRGSWTMDDSVRAGVFIDLPERHGYLALAYLATGRIGYDYGAITSAGDSSWWYFYNPNDLGAAAQGKREPGQIVPHSRAKIDYPSGLKENRPGGQPTGCCFDQPSRLLYVYQQFCIDNESRELFPCIHVYHVE